MIGLAKHSRSTLYCSFCGKKDGEVGYLVAGPTVFICNECIELCREIGQNILCETTTVATVDDPKRTISFDDFKAKHFPKTENL